MAPLHFSQRLIQKGVISFWLINFIGDPVGRFTQIRIVKVFALFYTSHFFWRTSNKSFNAYEED
jgi:hypothetical protein